MIVAICLDCNSFAECPFLSWISLRANEREKTVRGAWSSQEDWKFDWSKMQINFGHFTILAWFCGKDTFNEFFVLFCQQMQAIPDKNMPAGFPPLKQARERCERFLFLSKISSESTVRKKFKARYTGELWLHVLTKTTTRNVWPEVNYVHFNTCTCW